jgi:hypothetical protein
MKITEVLYSWQTPNNPTNNQYIDIKHFAILDWVEQDLLILHDIHTSDNCADAMTKALAATLHH